VNGDDVTAVAVPLPNLPRKREPTTIVEGDLRSTGSSRAIVDHLHGTSSAARQTCV
jgi:hypothetical protein